MQLYVNGVTNRTISYTVQASRKLTDRIPIRTNGGSFTFTDTNANDFLTRLYRAASVP